MIFQVTKINNYSWRNNPGLTVGGLIATIIGATTHAQLINIICAIYGLATGVSSLVPSSGSLNEYRVRAQYVRFATVNGSNYAYNTAHKFIDYKGYEDANNNSTSRAYADSSTRDVSYAPGGESYYNSYSQQVADAYDMFLQIGQQP